MVAANPNRCLLREYHVGAIMRHDGGMRKGHARSPASAAGKSQEITVYKSMGHAMEDVVTATLVYLAALAEGLVCRFPDAKLIDRFRLRSGARS
jgi:hypothetical protein